MRRIALIATLLLASLGVAAAVPGARTEVLERAADTLESRYVDAAQAARLAAMLRGAARDGRFDGTEPRDFAAALTRALREVVPDVHLTVTYEPTREFDATAGVAGASGAPGAVVRTARVDGRSREEIARTNFGVDRVEHLEGNVGYLRISRFVPLDYSRETVEAAIALIAHSAAVVVDLRDTIGGSPDAVAAILSAFFPADGEPRVLHASANRARGIENTLRTEPALARPALATAPLFVLTGKNTASAAEMFAYAAQRLGRGTVVGERSAGAGNGGVKQSIGEGFALFVPEWRTLTGPGWEGTGVAPDHAVAVDDALDAALALARKATAAAPR